MKAATGRIAVQKSFPFPNAQEFVHAVLYIQMRLSWDEPKSRSNQRKHGISFDTASRVFLDPLHLSRQDRIVEVKNVGRPSGW
jgi:hypothetical protein